MTALLIGLITLAAVALTVHSARRSLAERNAVDRHHQAMEAIGALADRAHHGPAHAPAQAPGSLYAPVANPDPGPSEYQPRHRKSRPPRRTRATKLTTVVGAVLILAAAVATGAWLATHSHRGGAPASPPPAALPTTTAVATTTPTTSGPPVVLISSDSRQAQYRLQRPSVDLELAPSAPCWVEIKSGSGLGTVLFAGTLRPGNQRSVPTTATSGGVSVQLGNPGAMSVSVDGAALPIPVARGSLPFTLVLRPGA